MATYYVSSVAGDNSTGLSWATAKTSVSAALALANADGDIIYVDSAHSFSAGTAIAWDVATDSTKISIISVNRNGSTTTGHSGWLAGALERTNANNATFLIMSGNKKQSMYIYGLTIKTGTGISNTNTIGLCQAVGTETALVADTCIFNTPYTGGASFPGLQIGPFYSNTSTIASKIKLINCSYVMPDATALTGPAIILRGCLIEISGLTLSYTGANKPGSLFGGGFTSDGFRGKLTIRDSDLSGFDSGNYFDVSFFYTGAVELINCKLNATPSIVTGTFNQSSSITLINTDSGNTNTVFEYRDKFGTITESTSIYYQSGSKMQGNGISWQIVTTSACSEASPFVCPWLIRPSTSTSLLSVGFRINHDSATNLTNRDCWPEIEYLSNASFPQGTLSSGRNSQPFDGTGVDWTTSSDTWVGTSGFTNENKQTVQTSVTPSQAGVLRGRLLVSKASKTLYVDPLLKIS